MLFLTNVKRRKMYNIGYNIRKGTIPSKSKLLSEFEPLYGPSH